MKFVHVIAHSNEGQLNVELFDTFQQAVDYAHKLLKMLGYHDHVVEQKMQALIVTRKIQIKGLSVQLFRKQL